MNYGYVENTETGERRDIDIEYKQPIRVLLAAGVVGFIIGTIDRWAFNRGIEACNRKLDECLEELDLVRPE